MTFPFLAKYSDVALLLLRLALAVLFGVSGWSHASRPKERAESVGLPVPATFALGVVEVAAAVLLVVGLWVQPAALVLAAIMLGATFKKAFVWKTGFWGESNGGWYYELLYLVCNLVLATVGGGAIGIG